MGYSVGMFLFNENEFSASLIARSLERFQANTGEEFVLIDISGSVKGVVYDPGRVSSKFAAFSVTAEFFLADDFFIQVADLARETVKTDFAFLGWVYNSMNHYTVLQKFTRHVFEGRALADGLGERVKTSKGKVEWYETREIAVDPDAEDVDAVQELLERPFDPFLFIKEELGVTRQELESAIFNPKRRASGARIWPEKLKEGDDFWDHPDGMSTILATPLWEHLSDK